MRTPSREPDAVMPVWPVAWMTVIAALLLGLASRQLEASGLIAAVVLLFLVTGWPKAPRPRAFYTIVLFVPFIVWWKYGMEGIAQAYLPVALLYLMAFYVLALAVHHILAHRNGGSLDHALGCSVLALGVAGAGDRGLMWVYLPLVLVFVSLLVAHLRWQLVVDRGGGGRFSAWARYVLAFSIGLVFATANEAAVVPAVPEASQWLLGKLIPKSPSAALAGNSRSVKLDTVRQMWGGEEVRNQIMLRVWATHIDKYLRGATYSIFDHKPHGSVWTNPVPADAHETPLKPRGTYMGMSIFGSGSAGSGQWYATVSPGHEVADTFFLPLGTHEIAAFSEKVFVGPGQTMRPEGLGAAGGYKIAMPSEVHVGRPNEHDTRVPALLYGKLREIAQTIFTRDMPVSLKLRRIEVWFEDNFEYDLTWNGYDMTREPVMQFLEEQRRGHCEYFASACVLLLRAEGIPARYVTGFVAEERGLGDTLWLVRRKHAHAWAEAFVEGEGWVRVEPTPTSGLPETGGTDVGQRWSDWFAAHWNRLTRLLLYGGLSGLFGAAWEALVAIPKLMPMRAWLGLVTLGSAWIFRAQIAGFFRHRRVEHVSERVRELRERLAEAEKLLRRHGITRPPGRTVATHLRAVRSAGALPDPVRTRVVPILEEYVDQRYRREPAD